jgi:hypothetical protein
MGLRNWNFAEKAQSGAIAAFSYSSSAEKAKALVEEVANFGGWCQN